MSSSKLFIPASPKTTPIKSNATNNNGSGGGDDTDIGIINNSGCGDSNVVISDSILSEQEQQQPIDNSISSLNLADSVELQINNHFVPLIEKLQNEIIDSRSKICNIIEGYEAKLAKIQQQQQSTPRNVHSSDRGGYSDGVTGGVGGGGGVYTTVKKSMVLHQEQLNRSRLEKEKTQHLLQIKDLEKTIEKLQASNAQYIRNVKNIEKEKTLLEKQVQNLEKEIHHNSEKQQQLLVQTRKEKEKILAENREEIKNIENGHLEEIKQLKQVIKREQEKTNNYKSKFEDSEKQLTFLQHEYKQKFQMLEMENRRLQQEVKSLKQTSSSSYSGSSSDNESKSSPSLSRNNFNIGSESPRYYGRYNPNLYN